MNGLGSSMFQVGGGQTGEADFSRQIATYDAALPVNGGHVVRTNSAGQVQHADSATVSDRDTVLGLSLNAAAAGATVSVLLEGEATDPAWNFLPDLPLFLGLSGQLTQTAPAVGFWINCGHAITPTSIFIRIGESITLA